MVMNYNIPAGMSRFCSSLRQRFFALVSLLRANRRIIRRVMIRVLVILGLLSLIYALIPRPPLWDGLNYSVAYYDREQRLLRLTLAADDKYRLRLPLEQIAPEIIEATLLYEDRHFFRHPGVNPFSLVRAAWQTINGGRLIGGSTLTMQLARIRFNIDSRSVTGKIRQIIRALQIELFYSKRDILEAYLGLAPYGGNVEGVGAASLIYYGKPAGRLTLSEALSLCIIPQSPARRLPGRKDLDGARELLARKWVEAHPTAKEKEDILSIPLVLRGIGDLPFLAPHFVDALDTGNSLTGAVTTTLDLRLQAVIERQTSAYLARLRGRNLRNASVLLVDYRSMEVRALLGSADFFNDAIQGQVNGTRARRSPGSTLKPFIYALGMEQGLIHPLTMLKDAPARFGGFNPENFDYDFSGPINVHDALIRSRNLPAAQLALRLRQPSLYEFMKQVQVQLPYSEDYYGLALALGGAEVTMEELVQMYAMLANGGKWRKLRYLKNESDEAGIQLLSPETCFLTLDILKDNPRPAQGFRSEWTLDNFPVCWKTGTSHGFRDAWSVGIFGPYVLAVWIGNFDGSDNPSFIGIEAAAPLLFEIIDAVRAEDSLRPYHPTPTPNLAKVQVCAVSGQIPGPHCRHTVFTWFSPGVSPITVCDIHRAVSIDIRTGLRACRPGVAGTRTEVFEYWPSDLLQLFKKAGVPRRVPPPENPDCPLDVRAARGNPPQITSPQAGIAYSYRATEIKKAPLTFSAVTDADVRSVYWFLDERFVGRSEGSHPFFWPPRPGRFTLRAVDDQGRSDARTINVQIIP
jgi:penicillin-binding protein 1C